MIKESILNHIEVSNLLLNDLQSIDNLCQIALTTILSSKKILLCGNGGVRATQATLLQNLLENSKR